MSKPIETLVLERVRATLSDPKKWARLTRSRDASGTQGRGGVCDELSSGAVRFCAIGAIHRHAFDLTRDRTRARAIMFKLRHDLGQLAGTPLSCVNDWHGRKAVVKLLDKALSN